VHFVTNAFFYEELFFRFSVPDPEKFCSQKVYSNKNAFSTKNLCEKMKNLLILTYPHPHRTEDMEENI
jgi:hypothetical protein